jgi:hypothetical protein
MLSKMCTVCSLNTYTDDKVRTNNWKDVISGYKIYDQQECGQWESGVKQNMIRKKQIREERK